MPRTGGVSTGATMRPSTPLMPGVPVSLNTVPSHVMDWSQNARPMSVGELRGIGASPFPNLGVWPASVFLRCRPGPSRS